MSNLNQNKQNEIQEFIELYKDYLKQNQIEILEKFNDKIFDFKLESHEIGSSINLQRPKHEALFRFNHLGIKIEIELTF